jgi:hypothetical protein
MSAQPACTQPSATPETIAANFFGHVLADGDIIQEKQRLCAAADDVVDAHGHAVDAHGVMLVHQLRNAEFGSHAVGAGDQHRLGHALQLGSKQAAEAADVTDHGGTMVRAM